MQKFFSAICLLPLLFFGACHNKEAKQVSQLNRSEESQSFFPVTDFFLGQINQIESLPVTLLTITVINDKKDSLWVNKKDIRKFALPFLQPVIDSISMQKFFTEKSFMDQTINAVTLTYDPKTRLPDSIKLNHWDIYIDPQKNSVQRIYLVKEDVINGDDVTTQLTWKVGKWCSIRTIVQPPNKEPQVKEEIMKWDFDD